MYFDLSGSQSNTFQLIKWDVLGFFINKSHKIRSLLNYVQIERTKNTRKFNWALQRILHNSSSVVVYKNIPNSASIFTAI